MSSNLIQNCLLVLSLARLRTYCWALVRGGRGSRHRRGTRRVRLRSEREAGRVVLRWGTWSRAAGARWRSGAGSDSGHMHGGHLVRFFRAVVPGACGACVRPRLASGSRIGPSRRLEGGSRRRAGAARRERHRYRGRRTLGCATCRPASCGPRAICLTLRRAWCVPSTSPWQDSPRPPIDPVLRFLWPRRLSPGRGSGRADDQTEARSRRLMSAHSSHTDAGSPRSASAARTPGIRGTSEDRLEPGGDHEQPEHDVGSGVAPRISPSTSAAVDITAPIPWANRLGGPGTGFLGPAAARSRSGPPPQRAQRRSGQHPRPEAVRQRDQQPVGAGREDHEHGRRARRRRRPAPPSRSPDSGMQNSWFHAMVATEYRPAERRRI